MNQQNKNKLTLNNKGNNFLRAQTSKMVKLLALRFGDFCDAISFRRKKKKKTGLKLS